MNLQVIWFKNRDKKS